ncbi:glucan biosynthesis protein [Desulfovibrio sp. OttesenSCG-928-A18]|nr:glucan biosynthesis protein [Desulfovibrio sp. OttesenSCG-928-A18]
MRYCQTDARSRQPVCLAHAGLFLSCVFLVLLFAASPFCPDAAAAPQAQPPAQEAPGAENGPPDKAEAGAEALFTYTDVRRKARLLAEHPYSPTNSEIPGFLRRLDEKQWGSIRFKEEKTLWREDNLFFTAQLFLPGFIYDRQVPVHLVEKDVARQVLFEPDMFDYADASLAEKMRDARINFAGFRLFFPLYREGQRDEFMVFLGATYFRAIGKNSHYGLSSRGLALNTALADGEEYPYFAEFWLIKPQPGDTSMSVYALMDSPRMTGAYHFLISPGAATVVDVESELFQRRGSQLPAKLGLAPLCSMFLFSEAYTGARVDYRPEVHNSDGLLYTDKDNWFWRPLTNPERLAVNYFAVSNPRGFGLMQRDNSFDHYQDIRQRFELRPSLWVEPKGDWGSGHLELIEIPSREDIHDNILAFWVPDPPSLAAFRMAERDAAPAGAQNKADQNAPLRLAYRMYWLSPGNTPHDLGRASATRMVRVDKSDKVRFIVDFEGEALRDLPADTGLTSLLGIPEQGQVLEKSLAKNPVTGGWRLDFTVRLPEQSGVIQMLSAREEPPRMRFSAMLKKGENLPEALTEVWVYDLSY